LCLFTKTNFVL